MTDDERRLLAVKGKALGRGVLSAVASIVTPDTILAWASAADRSEVGLQRATATSRSFPDDEGGLRTSGAGGP